MKKTALSGLAILIGGVTCSANAQSSVTLYGLIDVGIDFVNNSAGKQLWAMKDGTYTGIYGSRWGILGSEDLGGGLSAIFRIEGGFNIPNGTAAQGGLEFGRQAYVGLSSKTYGTVTLGRQYDSVVDFLQFAGSSSQMGTFTAHPQDVDNLVNSFRVNNSIKYFSPSLGGFRFSTMAALHASQISGRPRQVPFWSVGGDYVYRGLHVAAAYLYADQPAALFTGGDGHFVADTTGDAIGAAGPFSYIGHPDHMNILGAGATYTFGATTLAGLYTRSTYSEANGTRSDVIYDNYDVSVRHMVTPAVKFFVGNLYSEGHVSYLGQTLKYDRIAIGVDYALSKRTELYGVVSAQQAFGDARYANIYYGTLALMSTTNRQVGGRVGIVQRF